MATNMATNQVRVTSGMLGFGLHWKLLLAHEDFDNLLEARIMAKDTGYKQCVIHQLLKRTAVGFLPIAEPAPRGRGAFYSAAVIAALGSKAPSIYIAETPSHRYWLCYAQPDRLPRSDALSHFDILASESEIIHHLNDLLNNESLGSERPRVFTVGDVAIDSPALGDAVPLTFETFFRAAQNPDSARIKPISPSPYRFAPYAVAIVLLLAVAFGYREYDIRRAMAEEARLAAIPAEVNRLRAQRISEAVAASLTADTATVSPSRLAYWCSAFVGRLGDRYHGWKVASINCDPLNARVDAQLVTDYRAPETPNPATLNRAITSDGGKAQFAPDLQAVTLSYPLAPDALLLRPGVARSKLPRYSDHVNIFGSAVVSARKSDPRFLANLSPLSVRPIIFKDPTQRDPATRADTEQPVPDDQAYLITTIDLTAPVLPKHFPVDIDQQHFRIDRLEVTPLSDGPVTHIVLTALFQPG